MRFSGKTQGYYGPYIRRETVPTVYRVELPEGEAEYTVNILKGFVFRGWMDHLTFGRFGTGGAGVPRRHRKLRRAGIRLLKARGSSFLF